MSKTNNKILYYIAVAVILIAPLFLIAYLKSGDGFSNSSAAGKPASGLAAPQNLTATAFSASSIRINWQDTNTAESGFQIERSLSATSGFTYIGQAAANILSFTDQNLEANKAYYYRVRAFKVDKRANIYSSYSNVSGAKTFSLFTGPIVGAIRWDAWTGSTNGVGAAVEKTLSPNKYHYRVPFYGVENSTDSISAACVTQACMDQEISYAKSMCLDYWAFLWYPASSGLDQSRNLYLSSTHKNDINFTLVIEDERYIAEVSIAEIVNFMKMPQYQKVLGNRPLLYFLGYQNLTTANIASLRSQAAAAGLGNPYLVLMRTGGDESVFASLGLDAFSMYAVSWIGNGAPYSTLANEDIAQWNWMKSQGYKLVPHVTAGWDPRPRVDNPLPWDLNPIYTASSWVQMPTPTQLANHVQEAINWAKANPTTDDANAVIVYAWNEFDEGGYICPNLASYSGTQRLQALDDVICVK